MTDIDYCTGQNCHKKNLCIRYDSYLSRLRCGFDVKYARNGLDVKDCPQYQQKEFYGG